MTDVTVDCTIEGDLEVPSAHLEAMGQGVAVWSVESVKLILTDDVQGTVRALVPHLSTYRTERGSGRVAARVVAEVSPPIVVVDGPLVVEQEPSAAERLLAHEVGHLVLGDRGEVVGQPLLGPIYEGAWKRWLASFGGVSLEEFRIERTLFELGYGASPWRDIAFTSDTLYSANLDLLEALVDERSQDVEYLASAVCGVVSDLSKHFGYAAAWIADEYDWRFPVEELSEAGRADWRDFVGEHWDQRMVFYREVPPADEELDHDQLRNLLHRAGELEQDLLKRAGFYFSGPGEGGGDEEWGFWPVQDDSLWDDRTERALAEAKVRGDLE